MDVKARVGLAIVTAVPALWLAAVPAAASPALGTLPVTGPNLSPTVVLADTLIATGLLLGLVGLIALLQRRGRGTRDGG